MYSNFLPVITGVIIISYLCLFVFLAKKCGNFFLGSAALLALMHIRAFASLYLIESGSYVAEQQKYGFPNGSLVYYFVFSVVTLGVLGWFTKGRRFPEEVKSHDFFDVIYFILFAIEIVQSTIVHINWSPVDSFNFYHGVRLARVLLAVDLAFNGIYIAQMLRKTSLFWMWSALHLGVGLLKNSPMGPFIFAAEITLVALLFRGQFKPRHILICSVLGVVGLIFKWISLDSNSSLLANRFVQDFHVFWGSINLWNAGMINSDFHNFFEHFFDKSIFQVTGSFGLGELMNALNPKLAANMISEQVRFTGGFPAILIYKFGLPLAFALFIPIIVTYVVSFIFIVESSFVVPALVFVLEYKVFDSYRDFVMMGEFGQLNFKFFVYLACVLMYFAGVTWKKRERVNERTFS